jgi:5-methylcytosine-specific restriction endonuclease McrA
MRDLDHILTILRPIMTGMAKNLDYSLRPMAGTDVAATRWSLVAALPAFVQLIRPAHLCNCAQTSNTVDLFPHWCKGCFGEVWNRSPYDGDWVYWSTRRGQYPTVSPRLAYLLKRQRGHCALCRLFFQHDDQLEIDHISGDHRDSRYANLQAIHGHCHDAKTRANGEYLPVGVRDKHQGTEERSARKRARSVLEQREVERSASRL